MQEIIEKLLVLQDRDRKLLRVTQELAHIGPERESLKTKAASTQTALEAAKLRVRQIESERKQRDLEIEGKKAQIDKYLNQQLQTRKNEEFSALARASTTPTSNPRSARRRICRHGPSRPCWR